MKFIIFTSDFYYSTCPKYDINCSIRQFDLSFCAQEMRLKSGLWSKTMSRMYIGSAGTSVFSQFSCQLLRIILSKQNFFQIDSWVKE